MLADTGLSLQDFDFYEIHEAFAAQVLCTLRAWESEKYCKQRLGLTRRRWAALTRPNSTSRVARWHFGHPFAATGGRIVATLAKFAGSAWQRPRADFGVHCRWHGCGGHAGKALIQLRPRRGCKPLWYCLAGVPAGRSQPGLQACLQAAPSLACRPLLLIFYGRAGRHLLKHRPTSGRDSATAPTRRYVARLAAAITSSASWRQHTIARCDAPAPPRRRCHE
jgi:hypothetical protein